jgi:DNA-binding SARP family transcriptional activator
VAHLSRNSRKSHLAPLGGKIFVLELLGTVSLRSDTAPVPVAAQHKRPLGLLAILALSGSRGLSRDRIEAYLWPESTAARARHALDQVVYGIRQALGSDSLLSTGRELRLHPEFIRADTWEFEEAMRADRWPAAVALYKGPLLDGFHFTDSRELETWIETERGRFLQQYQTALERLANRSAETGDLSQSVIWWRRLATSDPLSAGVTKKLLLALAAAGDRAGAVKHARLYQELVRQELEMEPDSEIQDLASSLSHPELIDTVGSAPRTPQTAKTSLASKSILPEPGESDDAEGGSLDRSPRKAPRMERSRIAAISSLSVLVALLIGAVAVETRRRDRPSSVAETTVRRGSRTALAGARDAYLRGLDAWSDGTKAGLDSAVVYLRQATMLDPDYADAYAGLANAYVMLGYFGYRPRDEMLPRAKEAALRGMRLDSTLVSARPALAYVLAWERNFAMANAEFRKAITVDPTYATARTKGLDPTDAKAHRWYAILLMILAEKPEAVAATRRATVGNVYSLGVPVTEITFTKWVTTYPAMSGFTSYGNGTMAGQIISRIDDGVSTHMIARYEITDPSGAGSFVAVVQGRADNKSGKYDLYGIVSVGRMIGAHVHASFLRITSCEHGTLNVCFRGTITIQRGQ